MLNGWPWRTRVQRKSWNLRQALLFPRKKLLLLRATAQDLDADAKADPVPIGLIGRLVKLAGLDAAKGEGTLLASSLAEFFDFRTGHIHCFGFSAVENERARSEPSSNSIRVWRFGRYDPEGGCNGIHLYASIHERRG